MEDVGYMATKRIMCCIAFIGQHIVKLSIAAHNEPRYTYLMHININKFNVINKDIHFMQQPHNNKDPQTVHYK